MFVKKSTLLLFLLLASVALPAQKSDRYLKKMRQEGYTLYFLVPTGFKAKADKMELEADFTFQYREGAPESVDMRFSVFSRSPVKQIDRLAILWDGKRGASPGTAELLFIQKEKKNWHSRFSTAIPFSVLMQMIQASFFVVIEIEQGGKSVPFASGKDWKKASEVLGEILSVELR